MSRTLATGFHPAEVSNHYNPLSFLTMGVALRYIARKVLN
ncbi:hypothetical protein J2W71_001013 [Pseudomonas sp. 3400]|nr:hypothetical protein [Pseudomonas sp. 3400]MDR7011114.1 hypothetical protein [Pseudomonas alcaliphila]